MCKNVFKYYNKKKNKKINEYLIFIAGVLKLF